ncbi:MAG TPA: class III extradiol ring-cleavage dioxygenase, partial [Polyangiaceae bacterium]|nr:class III extradiol ring-cleavage dioxygenase [Polyangiaceae bacterium]
MHRRQALAALSALPCWLGCERQHPPGGVHGKPAVTDSSNLVSSGPEAGVPSATGSQGIMPAIFAAHGAPLLLDDTPWVDELQSWALAMPRPRSILMVSAHWEQRPTTLGAVTTLPLVYDFYGFPARYYQTRYPAPGAPELAARVRSLLEAKQITCADDPKRGLDHGAYV